MAVRSRRLWGPALVPLAGVWTLVYQVPVDRTAVMRSVFVVNNDSAVRFLGLAVTSLAAPAASTWQALVTGSDTKQLENLVANPGDRVFVYTDGPGGARCSGFGSLLAGVPV